MAKCMITVTVHCAHILGAPAAGLAFINLPSGRQAPVIIQAD
jgi:hypothetical protein